MFKHSYVILLTLIPISGVGTTYFLSRCDINSAIVFTTGRLMSTFLETGMDVIHCKCSRNHQLNVPSEARKQVIITLNLLPWLAGGMVGWPYQP
jgi:hypothetical protein